MFNVYGYNDYYIVNFKYSERYRIKLTAVFNKVYYKGNKEYYKNLRKLDNYKNQQIKEFISQNTIKWIFLRMG